MTTRPINSDELGEKGQSRFAELCADASLIANPATRDRAGWDYTVDFRIPENAASFDARPAPATVRVQVKTHWADRDEINLRLSSAEQLVKCSGPSFICVLAVDSSTLQFVSMRLIHCRGAFVERVLRKLRETQKQGRRPNKVTLRVKPSHYSEAVPPHHATLEAAFADVVAMDAVAYLTDKDSELKTIGFDGPRLTLNTTLEGHPEEIADAFIGRGEVEVGAFSVLETRFDIALPVPDAPSGPGRISFKPRPDDCELRLTDGDRSFAMKGKVYRPPALVMSATGLPRIRIETDFLELTLTIVSGPPKGRLDVKIVTLEGRCERRLAPKEWSLLYDLLDRMGSEGVTVEFAGAAMDDLRLNLKIEFPEAAIQWRDVASLAAEADLIFARTNAPNRRLRLAELWGARDDILNLSAMLHRPETVTGLTFNTALSADLPPDESLDGLLGHTFKLGSFTMALILSIQVRREVTEGMLRWQSGRPQLQALRWVTSLKDYHRLLAEQPPHNLRVLTGHYTRN